MPDPNGPDAWFLAGAAGDPPNERRGASHAMRGRMRPYWRFGSDTLTSGEWATWADGFVPSGEGRVGGDNVVSGVDVKP